ncbi:general odorant-binding protein 45-like [Uranotaenia lowii]|uniref:general odorant-binding protein 45-like n=1 Tax=Uranotaenia lowii TaxID=190385 RepID=UPI002479AB95|nr:general odorant-binding protein 45-like [Uranotaenia lowii]
MQSQCYVENVRCAERCVQIVLKSWDRCDGLSGTSYSQHFQPDYLDLVSANRTQCCIDRRLQSATDLDVCDRASIDWQCYRDHFGTLTEAAQYVPMPKLLTLNALTTCSNMLQIDNPALRLMGFSKKASMKARCLIRCVVIRQGLYKDVTGLKLDRFAVQMKKSVDSYQEDVFQCLTFLRDLNLDNCNLAARTILECFDRDSSLYEQFVFSFFAVPPRFRR